MATMTEQFQQALQRLASSAQEQESYLVKLGTAPSADELALEYSDALELVQADLDETVRGAARQLDRYLEEISGREHAELWTVAALHVAPEWMHVRELASSVLELLGSDPQGRTQS
jgi:hypothetical protein